MKEKLEALIIRIQERNEKIKVLNECFEKEQTEHLIETRNKQYTDVHSRLR